MSSETMDLARAAIAPGHPARATDAGPMPDAGTGPVVVAERLGKCYRIYDHPRDRLLQAFWGERRRLYREFWALHDVSFALERGRTLGIIGRNGSGKSTLLQLLTGILAPSRGHCTVHGRVGALLELGSGFNPEFSGLDNVYLNASVLGLSRRELEDRLDAILAFADIGDFIHQPVKTYSSGMGMRLAFAVQAHIDPEVLIVDEALAVGDELFQKKCYARLETLKDGGTSILLVTHSCPQIIQHCDQALLLHKGRARLWGEPAPVTVHYQRLIDADDREWDALLGSPGSGEGPPLPHNDFQAPQSSGQAGTAQALEAPAAAGDAGGMGHHGEPGRGGESSGMGEEVRRSWLDESLQPDSTVVYPDHGARIEDVRLLNEAGEASNVLLCGEGLIVEIHYSSQLDLRQVAFGCHIANHTGTRITGQIFPIHGRYVEQIEAGQRWCLRFRFNGGLWPGVYFIGGGIWSPTTNRRFLHRVVDFRALRVVETQPMGVIGHCNLSAAAPEWAELPMRESTQETAALA